MTPPYRLRGDTRAVAVVARKLAELADGFPAPQANELAEELLERIDAGLDADGLVIATRELVASLEPATIAERIDRASPILDYRQGGQR